MIMMNYTETCRKPPVIHRGGFPGGFQIVHHWRTTWYVKTRQTRRKTTTTIKWWAYEGALVRRTLKSFNVIFGNMVTWEVVHENSKLIQKLMWLWIKLIYSKVLTTSPIFDDLIFFQKTFKQLPTQLMTGGKCISTCSLLYNTALYLWLAKK